MLNYFYIFATIIFTVYGQIILKWRLSLRGAMPEEIAGKIKFLANAFLDPLILSALY